MDDSGIIELYWQRNSAAIDETDKKYGALCRALANRILGDERDGEDDETDGELSMNYYDIVPKDITLGSFCALLNEYWGFDGYTLASTVEDEFYHYATEVPRADELLTAYANAPYLTVFFDGDQAGVPMYIELSSYGHPYGVYFTVGTNHSVG